MCGASNCPSQQQDCNTQDCNPEPDLRGEQINSTYMLYNQSYDSRKLNQDKDYVLISMHDSYYSNAHNAALNNLIFVHTTGLQHVGCYFFPGYRRLRLLEGDTPDLSDNPRTRTNPIGKCGAGAQASGYRVFSISTGYCISGSNRISDYQYVQNTFCQNGIGGTVRATNGNLYYVMDVYQIQDPQVFLDSVSQVATTTEATEAPATTESSDAAGADLSIDNGAPVINTSLTLLLTLAIITLISILLQ